MKVEKEFAGQLRHDALLEDPFEVEYFPAAQTVQKVAAEICAKEPGGQSTQDAVPLLDLNSPGGHGAETIEISAGPTLVKFAKSWFPFDKSI